jgi:hypothetical protein
MEADMKQGSPPEDDVLSLLREAQRIMQEYGETINMIDTMRKSIDLLEIENLALKRMLGAPNPRLTYKELLNNKDDNSYFDRRATFIADLEKSCRERGHHWSYDT